MARKLRLEFPGARYHIINRGNYRTDVFALDSTKAAFENCLLEATEKWDWVLYAFVVMRNHFHLAVETRQPNLVLGMQWLQATFASRFNRHRQEHGHLFQGRYRALVIGGDDMLGMVCDYLHLNPAAAKFMGIADLAGYRYSSYWYLRSAARRPERLRVETALAVAGGLTDDAGGWGRYDEHLAEVLVDQAKNKRRYVQLCRGWAIGSDAFKAALIAQHAPAGLARAWTVPGAQQMRDAQWDEYLGKILAVLGRTVDEARKAPKSETWKLAVATWMRDSVRARHNWLSLKLGLGAPAVISRNLARYQCRHQASDPTWQALRSSFST